MTDLFAADPPSAKNEMQAEHLRLYAHLRSTDECADDRAYVNERWKLFEQLGLADPDFEARFATECGSRIWEMQLATTFSEWNWKLVPARKRGEGPDFGVECTNGLVYWIEATAPTAGAEEIRGRQNPDKVRAPTGQVLFGAEIDRTIMLRYLGTLTQKRDQYRRALDAGLVAAGDGYVVAVSGAMVPEAMMESEDEMPRIVRALFGVGERVYRVPLDGGPIGTEFASQDTVGKSTGTAISMRAFADGSVPEIGAVIFSPSYLKERPERRGRPAGSDYIFVMNPHADRPFPFSAPRGGRVFFVGLQMDDRRS